MAPCLASIEFFNAATAEGIKPIIGVETYLAARGMRDRDPKKTNALIICYCWQKTQTGYNNLLKIACAAQLDGFYYKPRIDREMSGRHCRGIDCHFRLHGWEKCRALTQ